MVITPVASICTAPRPPGPENERNSRVLFGRYAAGSGLLAFSVLFAVSTEPALAFPASCRSPCAVSRYCGIEYPATEDQPASVVIACQVSATEGLAPGWNAVTGPVYPCAKALPAGSVPAAGCSATVSGPGVV